ncbi:MAG: DUF2341 domain-containing protein [Nitrospiraceae bacterium]|nr:MAG: DUF2341 domain-containing protein [Nitrospiraceae bacterium]
MEQCDAVVIRKLRAMSYELRVKKKKEDKKSGRWEVTINLLSFPLFAAVLLFTVHCSLFTAAFAAGGDIIWQYRDAQPGKQEATAAAVDSAGSMIITGHTDASGLRYYYTVKLKADGSGVLWSRTYSGTGNDDPATAIAVDSDDNVIVTGYIWNGSSFDYHTIKYNGSDGTVMWEHTYNATVNGNDYATSVAVDSLNNVYVGGNSQGSNGADDFTIVKYGPNGPNPDGTPIWVKSYNGASNKHDRITSITAGSNGIAVTGTSQNSTPDFDALTIKMGFDGSTLWEKRKSVSGDDKGIAVRMDLSGNVIMTATTYNGTNKDIYVVKYDGATGTVLWQDTRNGGYNEEPADLYVDASGDVYITGYAFILSGVNNIFTARYSSAGVLLWSRTYNSSNGNSDVGVRIVVDESGDLFVAGDSYDITAGNYNFITLKYKKDTGTLLWVRIYDSPVHKNDRAAGLGINSVGEVMVAASSDIWTGGAEDYDYFAIKYDPGLLNPPTDLTAVTFSTTQINLSWSDNSSTEDGFRIERKIGDFGTYAAIAAVGPDESSYNDTGLTPETQYYYRVQAFNASEGDSYYSNETYAVTSIISFAVPPVKYSYGGPDRGDDYVSALAVGPDYHPVVTGFSYSLAGQFDYYTMKLDRDDLGLIWDARFDSDQNDMDIAITAAVDSNNDVLVSGFSFMYSAGAGENTNDIYSIKYPSTGPPEEWNDQYNGPAGDDDRSSVVAISTDGNNNYAIVGYGRNISWDDDIYLLKYLPDGTRVWAAEPYNGGRHDYPSSVAFDPAGNIIVAGHVHNGSDYDFFVRKYRGTDGTPVWTDVYNVAGSGNDFTRGLAVDSSGNAYVTGVAVSASGNEDFYTIKYSGTDGSRLWERSFNGLANGIDEPVGIAFDRANDDVVIAGTTLVSSGNNDFHIIRYDTEGNVVWARTLDRPEYDDFAVAMSIDLTGNVHVAGDTYDGLQTDIISVQYDFDGNFAGGSIYNGAAGGNDGASAVTVNRLGEAFVGGQEVNSSGDTDYIVYKVESKFLQAPAPLTAELHYTRADLFWSDNSLIEDGYHLERKLGTCAGNGTWTSLQTILPDTTSYVDDTLNIGATYCYRVRTFDNESGQTSRWAEREVTTFSPAAPSGLAALAVNTTDIALSWNDNTTIEDGFVIERCAGSGCADFTELVTVSTNTLTYTDSTACESQTYSYRIKAFRTAQWTTDYSNTASAATMTLPGPASLGLTVKRISEAEIGLTWNYAAADETGYEIQRCTGGAPVCTLDTDFTGIASLSVYDLDPVLLLHMDEENWNGTVNEVRDSSGKGNHGTSYNGANTAVGGQLGRAGSFDGTNDYIRVPHSSSINPTTALTVELWAKSDAVNWNTHYTLASKRNAYILGPVSGTKEMRFYIYSGGNWRYASYVPTIDIKQWHHYTGTFDGMNIRLYIDGVQVAVTAWTGTINPDTGPLFIGMDDGQNRYLDGQIDEVAIYRRALSLKEIEEHYSSGVSLSSRFYVDKGLNPSQEYTYRMRSLKSAACSWQTAFSSPVSGTTTLIVPDDLKASVINTTRIDLTWTDNTQTETGFIIERCSGTLCDFSSPDMTGSAGPNASSYSDTAACEGQTYRYRVRADRNTTPVWQSGWSEPPATASTAGISGNGPASLSAVTVSESVIDLTWTDNTGDETGYSVERCSVTGCSAFTGVGATEPTAGAVLLLAMEEVSWSGAAGEVRDMSGNGYHGTAYGGVTTVADGWEGRAGSFDGSNDSIETGLSINQSSAASPAVTMEAWVYPTSTSSGRHEVISTDNGGYDWSLLRNGGTWTVFNGTGEFSTGLSVEINQWQHIAAVFTPGTGVTFYKNGQQTASTSTISYDASTAGVVIGSRSAGEEFFDGKIDDVAVYNRALTSSEIERHYELGIQAGSVKRYRDTGLDPSVNYTYRVRAYKNAACPWTTSYSNEATAETDSVPAPTHLSLTVINSTTIDLNWWDNTMSETGFRIERCIGAGCDFSTIDASFLRAPDVGNFRDNSVCEGTVYRYRVRAEKDDGPVWNSAWSTTAEGTTIAKAVPENLSARIVSESEIELNWTDNGMDETGFRLLRCMGAGCEPVEPLSNLLTTYGATAIYHMDEALWNNTADEVRDFSGNGYHGRSYGGATTGAYGRFGRAGVFDGSNDYISTSLNLDQSVGSPGVTMEAWLYPASTSADWRHVISTDDDGVEWTLARYGATWRVFTGAAEWNTGLSVDVNQWQHIVVVFTPGTGITAYKNSGAPVSTTSIAYNTDDRNVVIGKRARDNNYFFDGRIDEVGIYNRPLASAEVQRLYEQGAQSLSAKRFTDTGLITSETYRYRVWSYKDSSCAWESGHAEVDPTVIPPDPENLASTAVGTTRVDLSWTDRTADETGFKIERCTGAGCVNFTEISEVPTDVRTYSDMTVCEGTQYNYRVRAYRISEWVTGYSNESSAITSVKSAPTSLSAARVSEMRIDLSWSDKTNDETGFKIERCAGAGCTDFSEIAITAANVTFFSDIGLLPQRDYTYRLRAYKIADCGWTTAYSNTSTASTAVTAPAALTATAVNTTRIDLSWTINSLSETGLKIERCDGASCGNFAEIGAVDSGVSGYSDTTVCSSSSYTYRVKAVKEGILSNNGGGCWTRRVPLSMAGFERYYPVFMEIAYDADMKTDFSDIRFYDETAQTELPYWIESRTDGVSAAVYFRTLGSNNVYMYYGNASASDAGGPDRVFELYEDFSGNTIDTSRWVQIDPDNSIVQNDGLILNDVSDNWTKALISKQTYRREDNKELYLSLTIAPDTDGNNHFMAGWESDQTSNPSYNQLVHGLYWNNYLLSTYELNNHTGPNTAPYAANTDYEMRVILKPFGAEYYVKGGAYDDWKLLKKTSTYSNSLMRVAIAQYSHQATVHLMMVRKYAAVEPVVSAGTEEQSACYSFTNTWSTIYSSPASAATPSHAGPSGLVVSSADDTGAELSWTDNTMDETGFRIGRCAGQGCSSFTEVGTVRNPSLVLLLHMNEASWGSSLNAVTDSSEHRNHGTAYNGANTAAEGKYDRGGSFDGANDYINIPHSSSLNPSGAISVELWAKSDTTNWNKSGILVSKRNAYILYPVSGSKTIRFYIYDGGWYYATYTPGLGFDLKQWHHYAGTYDGSSIKLYVDGTLRANVPHTGSISPDTGPLRIGWDDEMSASYFDGMMDEVAIYDSALTAAEVQAHFNDGVPVNAKYTDTGIDPETTYCYRVSAFKTAACGWESDYSNESCEESLSARPTNLTATAINSMMIRLDWDDNSADEEGYEIEKRLFNGTFIRIALRGPGETTFTDAMGVEPQKEHRYRVRTFRGTERSPYSNEAAVITPVWQAGDDTCQE